MKNRISGMIVGGAIADAVGIISELYPDTRFQKPDDTLNVGIQPGYWGESTSTFLALLLNFPSKEGFRKALKSPDYSPTGVISNLDPVTEEFTASDDISVWQPSYDAMDAGPLVRTGAITLLYFGCYSSILYKTKVACHYTHKNPLCLTACKLYVALLDGILHGYHKKELFKPEYYSNLDLSVPADMIFSSSAETDGVDEAIDILRVAVKIFRATNNYAEGLAEILKSTLRPSRAAAVYGQLAGAYYGITDIKPEWIDALQSKEIISAGIRHAINGILPRN